MVVMIKRRRKQVSAQMCVCVYLKRMKHVHAFEVQSGLREHASTEWCGTSRASSHYHSSSPTVCVLE